MALKTIYTATISLLTPLHIGSGAELKQAYDYVTRRGKTWIIHSDNMLDRFVDDQGNFDARIIGRPAEELLESDDFSEGSDAFRYVLAGMPRSHQRGAVIREQYKNVHDHPYIPGSSLKGALRTVLAWHGFRTTGQKLNADDLGYSRNWAGQRVERDLFGRNPNYDLLRALQVSDSEPQPQERLQIINAQVFTGGDRPGAPIELEAVRSDTVFTATIAIDEYQHSNRAERILKHGQRWQWLTELPQIAQQYGLERTTREMAWFRKRNYAQVAGFYGQLSNALKGGLGKNRFLLQIGWGGGWNGKTIGHPLQQDQQAWERLLGHKRLSPARMRRASGSEFPKSRRAVSVNDVPAAPLGWCIVDLKEQT